MNQTPDYMILVNEDCGLPENFESTVQMVTVPNGANEQIQVEAQTYRAFLALRQDLLENDGIRIELLTSYRSVQRQEEVFALNLKKYGMEHTRKYVALPGHSEHHTGFAIDVSIMQGDFFPRLRDDLFAIDAQYKTVHKKLARYGFILRYPEGKTPITKIGYEPWHWRYIANPQVAEEIMESGICFEEYWSKQL